LRIGCEQADGGTRPAGRDARCDSGALQRDTSTAGIPPSFHYTPSRLHRILTQLDPVRRNVVEFRHRSWWNDEVVSAFCANDIIFCSCSGPRLPDKLVQTADEIYIRFHGVRQWYRHDYSTQELTIWAEKIKASGASRVWAYFNNDREEYAIKNAHELLRQLGRK
jgi:uncharacterized protein YecE (DUF72 family)